MDGHVRRRDAQSLRDQVTGRLGGLEAAPHLALPVHDARHGRRRLHGRVRQVRNVVFRAQPARGAGDAGVEVPVVADDGTRLARGFLERGLERGGVVVGVRPVVPADLQRPAALHRGPGVPADDGDAAQGIELGRSRASLDRDDPDDTRDLERIAVVVARDRAAVDRRARDDGVEHVGKPRVDAVLRLAGRDVAAVDQLDLPLADVAELRGVLQTERLPGRDGLLGRGLGQGPVAEAPARRPMHDLVVLRLDLGHRHLPLGRRRRLQHGAGGRAAAAHRIEEVARAARAVGVLVAVALLVPRRLDDLHALPVGLQLVGDDHRHPGPHALSHLGAVADDRHRAVVRDGDEGEGVVDPAVGHAVRAVLRRVVGAGRSRISDRQHEAAQGGHALEESPPAHVGDRHGGAVATVAGPTSGLMTSLPAGRRPA